MDLKQVYELMEKLENSKLSKLELTEKDFSIKLEKETSVAAPVVQPVTTIVEKTETVQVSGNVVTAPIVGTFYRASSPEKAPFVEVGQSVHKGDVVCIIEAMKLFNEVQSDYSGTVKEILVQDGDLLEYGQPIMILE